MMVLIQLLNALSKRGVNLDMIQKCVSRIKSHNDAKMFLGAYLEEVRQSQIESLYDIVKRGVYISAFKLTKIQNKG